MPPGRGDKPQRDVLVPGTAPPNHARDDRRRRRPSSASVRHRPPLSTFARHYSDALPHLPSAALRGRRARSFVERAARGGRRPVTRHRAASGSRWSREGGEWRPRRRRPRPRRRRRGTRSTTSIITAVLPSGRRCRGAPSAPAAAPRLLDLPVSFSLIDPLPVLLIIFFILCNV